MLLVVVAILSIILAFGDAPLAWLRDPRLVIAAVATATLLPAGLAVAATARARRLFELNPHDPRRAQNWMADSADWIQYTLGALHAGVLCLTDWMGLCNRLPIVGEWPAIPGIIATFPFLISLLLVWIASYPAERAARQIALEISLFRGQTVRPVWTLAHYLAFNFRHQVLFILVPMMSILVVRDLLAMYVRNPNVRDPLLGGAAALVAVLTPAILRHVWITRPLPAGALRDRLQQLAAKLKIRCREILVWETDGMVVNAAVVGVVPPLRYVLLSDAMLERMDESKIEAVFGHESGHVKRHHITYILMFSLISGCLLTVFGQRTRGMDPTLFQWATAAVGLLLLAKWAVVFTWISWQFERQADVFGAEALALAGLPCNAPCALHHAEMRRTAISESSPGPLPPTGRAVTPALGMAIVPDAPVRANAICATAASIFADTLHDVAKLNGVSPDAGSWRHPSISARSRGLLRLALDPAAAAQFERQISWIKLGIFTAALGSAAWAVYELRLWTLLGI